MAHGVMGLDAVVWVDMAYLEELTLPLNLALLPLTNPLYLSVGRGGAYIGRDGACEVLGEA